MGSGTILTQSVKGERDYLFDNLKALLILLVVFGHIIELYMLKTKTASLIDTLYFIIYIFHMPFFVFVSGYFSKNAEKCRRLAISTFLIPYLVFNVINYYYFNYIVHETIKSSIFLSPIYVTWYLLSMFIWRLTIREVGKIRYIIPLSILIGLGVGYFTEFGSLLSLSRTIVLLPFFVLGYKFNENTIKTIRNKIPWYVGLMGVAVSVAATYSVYKFTAIPWNIVYMQMYASGQLKFLDGVMYRSIMYLLAFAFIFFLIIAMSKTKSFFSSIGRNTLPVFIFHEFFVKLWPLINPFAKSKSLNLIGLTLFSLILTFVLSRSFFLKLYDSIFHGINRLIFNEDPLL